MNFVPQRNGSSSLVALTEDLAGCSNAPAFFVQFVRRIWGRAANLTDNNGPGVIDMGIITKIKAVPQLEHATIDWLARCLARGKNEIFTDRVLLNPGVAADILRRNPDNRNVSQGRVEFYAKDMRAGDWAENGEAIIISRDGQLNDGQHRLNALIDANIVLPFLFVFGVDRESRVTVDQGAARTAGDFLAMDGVKYSKNAATAARWLMSLEATNGVTIGYRSKYTNAEIVRRVKCDEEIIASCAWAHRHYKQYRQLCSLTAMVVAHYLLSEINRAQAEEYLDQIALGENIKRGDPAFAVRQALMGEKTRERQEYLALLFHGWNAYRTGRQLKTAKGGSALPALV